MNINVIAVKMYTGRVRIAHVPYAMSLAMEKKKVIAGKTESAKAVDNKTIAQTVKGGTRVAHVPQVVRYNHNFVKYFKFVKYNTVTNFAHVELHAMLGI